MTQTQPLVTATPQAEPQTDSPPSERCVMLIFGASGDLTKRLLVPAIYNLACDGLLADSFAVIGTAIDAWNTESFREHMTAEIQKFHTRQVFDQAVWDKLVSRFY